MRLSPRIQKGRGPEEESPQSQRDNKILCEAPSLPAPLHLSTLFTHKSKRLLLCAHGQITFSSISQPPMTAARIHNPSKTHIVNSKRGFTLPTPLLLADPSNWPVPSRLSLAPLLPQPSRQRLRLPRFPKPSGPQFLLQHSDLHKVRQESGKAKRRRSDLPQPSSLSQKKNKPNASPTRTLPQHSERIDTIQCEYPQRSARAGALGVGDLANSRASALAHPFSPSSERFVRGYHSGSLPCCSSFFTDWLQSAAWQPRRTKGSRSTGIEGTERIDRQRTEGGMQGGRHI